MAAVFALRSLNYLKSLSENDSLLQSVMLLAVIGATTSPAALVLLVLHSKLTVGLEDTVGVEGKLSLCPPPRPTGRSIRYSRSARY